MRVLPRSRNPAPQRCLSSPPPELLSKNDEFRILDFRFWIGSSIRNPQSAIRNFSMRTLRVYVLREHAAPFFVTMGGLTAVLLVGNIIKFAELVVSKGVSPFDILRLMLYLIPYMLTFTVPMACLIAMVLAFVRL